MIKLKLKRPDIHWNGNMSILFIMTAIQYRQNDYNELIRQRQPNIAEVKVQKYAPWLNKLQTNTNQYMEMQCTDRVDKSLTLK